MTRLWPREQLRTVTSGALMLPMPQYHSGSQFVIALSGALLLHTSVCSQTVQGAGTPAATHPASDLIYEDIFGFSSNAETGSRGDKGAGLETVGRFAKRDGRYFALGPKYFTGYTFADNWWVGISAFGELHRIKNVSVQPVNLSRRHFDGASIEIMHRLIARTAANPFGLSVSFEPRWGRVDGGSGLVATSTSGEFKLFADAEIIPGKVFWAANANWAPGVQKDPTLQTTWVRSSSTNLSTAIAFAVGNEATLGAEIRYQSQFNKLLPRSLAGHALFVGPTAMVHLTDDVSLNGTFSMQVAGAAKATPDKRLDLDNFERRNFRVALQAAF